MTTCQMSFRRAGLAIMIASALAPALIGCSTSPTKAAEDLGPYSSLYDGKSDTAFATLMPVTSAPEALQRGDLALAQGDMDRALFEYIRALNFDDGNPTALYKIGVIHASRNNDQLAELAFRGAINADARNVGALTGLGVLLLKRRDYPGAKQYLEQAVAIDDRVVRAHNGLGVMADLERDYKTAQNHYQRALDASPGSPSLLNNLGYSRYMAGNWDGAITAFREALLNDPNYERAWRNLALVYTRQKRYDDAVEALTKIEDIPEAYNDVGYVAMLDGKLDKANDYFAEAKRLSPHFYALADTNQRRVELMQGHATTTR